MDRKNLTDKYSIGKMGEDLAAEFYENAGYFILARNWRWSNKGEIDIIAYNKEMNVIAICEVKTRKINTFVRACVAVNAAKQKKLRMLAKVFFSSNKAYLKADVRFDVAEVSFDCTKCSASEINLIENAF
ncbi:MAG: YraN family protein [Ruminococcaceae bacterium]|nr:YraN family protein [Oscillospiraceae bacterium]